MPNNTETRIIAHDSQYTNDTFSALGDAWNKSQKASAVYNLVCNATSTVGGYAGEYIGTAVYEALNLPGVDESGRARPGQGKPFHLLVPVQVGGDHWAGCIISCDIAGQITITSSDPLIGVVGGDRVEDLTDLREEVCAMLLSRGIVNVVDGGDVSHHETRQQDKVACGPYTFEILTTAVTGKHRANPGRMTLREEQLNMLPDFSEIRAETAIEAEAVLKIIREISVSKEVDAVLKIIGDKLHNLGELENVTKERFANAVYEFLDERQIAVLNREFDGNIIAISNNDFLVVQSRIKFHTAHDNKGMRPDVLEQSIAIIQNTMHELRATGLSIEDVRQVSGVREFVEQFQSNQDVNKLPQSVFAAVTNPASYEQDDLQVRVKSVYDREIRVDAAKTTQEGVSDILRAQQEAFDTIISHLLSQEKEVDDHALKQAISSDVSANEIAKAFVGKSDPNAIKLLSEQIDIIRALTPAATDTRISRSAEDVHRENTAAVVARSMQETFGSQDTIPTAYVNERAGVVDALQDMVTNNIMKLQLNPVYKNISRNILQERIFEQLQSDENLRKIIYFLSEEAPKAMKDRGIVSRIMSAVLPADLGGRHGIGRDAAKELFSTNTQMIDLVKNIVTTIAQAEITNAIKLSKHEVINTHHVSPHFSPQVIPNSKEKGIASR